MQSLYSYFLLKSSLRDLIEEELVAKYALNPALHDFADRKLFETKQNLIKTYFRNKFTDAPIQVLGELGKEELQEVEESYVNYEKMMNAEVKSIKNTMMSERVKLQKVYLKILLLPVSLAFRNKQDLVRIKNSPVESSSSRNLSQNRFILKLKEDSALCELANKSGVDWEAEVNCNTVV